MKTSVRDQFNWFQANSRILIIDDDPFSRCLMTKVLQKEGYDVFTAQNGFEGYQKAFEINPDLILLDIIMPVVDGFEICQRLQAEEHTKNIPIIFLTIKNEPQSKVLGLNLGAVDYVEKPVNIKEIVARVNTQIRIRTLNKKNLEYQQALVKAESLKSNRIFIKGVAHNFKNLMTVALGYINLIHVSSSLPQKEHEYLEYIERSLQRMSELIDQMMCLIEEAPSNIIPYNASQILEDTIFAARLNWPNLKFSVNNKLHKDTHIACDRAHLIKALTLIIKNCHDMGGEECEVYVDTFESMEVLSQDEAKKTDCVNIVIRDSGPGFSEPALRYATYPFFSTKNTVGVGLGLSIVQKVVDEYGGKIILSNHPSGGGVVNLIFPVQVRRTVSASK